MAGSSLGRSRKRRVIADINVVPYIDVMLVLLVIFMVTAPMMQQGLEVNLPKTSSSGISLNEDPFILVLDANGKIKISQVAVNITDLKNKLKGLFETRKNKQIYIQADKKVSYGTLAEVMAEVRAAGILNMSLVTLPKE